MIRFVVLARVCSMVAVSLSALSGCGDRATAPVASNTEEVFSTEIPREIRDRVAELRRVASAPDGGVSYWVGQGDGQVVELPPASVDGLAAALAAAGNNGTVLVRAGLHTESGMVTVTKKVKIIGEPGAILEFSTTPHPLGDLNPSLYLNHANDVVVWGVEIRPSGTEGGTAILMNKATHALIANNLLRNQQTGIFNQNADHAMIVGNTIIITPTAAAQNGIANCNGKDVTIATNEVSNGVFGIWACDEKGFLLGNNVHENFIGIILCKVPAPPNGYTLPGGQAIGSDKPGGKWIVTGNTATGNGWGYLVIDGANKNTLVNNAASASGFYDVEFTGDTYRFGFLTPASFNNRFEAGSYPAIVVKNCGNNNTIIGGQLVNINTDPCF